MKGCHSMKIGLIVIALALISTAASAQEVVIGSERVAFDMDGATLADVDSLVYSIADNGAEPTTLANVVCTGATQPFVCQAPLPALTPGPHSLTFAATRVVNGKVLTSARSVPLSLLMIAVPATPRNPRLIP